LVKIFSELGLISLTVPSHRNTPGLQPGQAIHTLSIQTIVSALERFEETNFSPPENPFQKKIGQALEELAKENQFSKANYLLKDL
jgi:hypothetical protein